MGWAQVCLAELRHELVPHRRSAFFEQFSSNPEFLAYREVFAPPRRYLSEDRQEINAFFREGIDNLLAMTRVTGFGDDSFPGEHPQAFGKNIGSNTFFRVQQLTEMPFAAENDVSKNQQRPFVAKNFERKINRAI